MLLRTNRMLLVRHPTHPRIEIATTMEPRTSMTKDKRTYNGRVPNKVKWKIRMCQVLHNTNESVSTNELAETSQVNKQYVKIWLTTLKKMGYVSTRKAKHHDTTYIRNYEYNMWTLNPNVSIDMLTEALL